MQWRDVVQALRWLAGRGAQRGLLSLRPSSELQFGLPATMCAAPLLSSCIKGDALSILAYM